MRRTNIRYYKSWTVLSTVGHTNRESNRNERLRRMEVWNQCSLAEKAFQNGDDIRKLWEKEAHIMAALTHPNVVSFIGRSDGEEGPAIMMECEYQSLQDYINDLQAAEQPLRNLQTLAERRRRAAPLLEIVVAVDLLTQIASGMAYLHSQDIAHLDLKLANLLITSHTEYQFLHVKIADLGHSFRLKGVSGKIRNPLPANHGTTVYRAMELFYAGKRVCFRAADVCSFGFTAWAILHCHEPRLEILHYDEEEEEPRVEIVSLTAPCYYDALVAGRRLGFDDTIPRELQALVKRCWDTNPDTRPPFSEIYWFLQSFKAKQSCDTGSVAEEDGKTEERGSFMARNVVLLFKAGGT